MTSQYVRDVAAVEEREPLLAGEDEERGPLSDDITLRPSSAAPPPRPPNPFATAPVYDNIWRIRRDVIRTVRDPYSEDQLRAPRLNTSMVRPYLEELYALDDASLVFCLLVNRAQFLREQVYVASGRYQSVHTSRALFCEIIASKLLRAFEEDAPGRKGLLLLAQILIAGFEPFQNAPEELCRVSTRAKQWRHQDRGGYEHKLTALEVAIISGAKILLSTPSCQKVIDSIYVGRIVYTPTSFIDIIPDHYKHRPISIYEPVKAPWLNQYRLVVPRTRNLIEIAQFIVLLVLYFLVMTTKEPERFSVLEGVFCLYTFGWILDQLATVLEHGWRVYSQNLWSFLDVTFTVIYLVYFSARMRGIATHDITTSQPALDVLALAGPFLIPRLAFNVFSESILFVALREMMSSFFLLTLLAVWTFAGFLLAMIWLGHHHHGPITVTKWMIWIWFGLDGTGIERSGDFHWLLGPALMVAFAFLGNTLFLTIVVSTLSAIFSRIRSNSHAEIQFRRTVLTFEGVKSDAIFAYPPPFNLLALLILLPLKQILSPRWFHKADITAVRFLNAPLLLAISWYERNYLWRSPRRRLRRMGHRHLHFSRFEVHGDIQAVFEAEPPATSPEDEVDEDNEVDEEEAELESPSTVEPQQIESPEALSGLPDKQNADGEAQVEQPSNIASLESDTKPADQKEEGQNIRPTLQSADSTASRPPFSRNRSRILKTPARGDSLLLTSDLEEQLHGLLDDYHNSRGALRTSDGDAAGGVGVLDRLTALEASLGRVEEMVKKLCK